MRLLAVIFCAVFLLATGCANTNAAQMRQKAPFRTIDTKAPVRELYKAMSDSGEAIGWTIATSDADRKTLVLEERSPNGLEVVVFIVADFTPNEHGTTIEMRGVNDLITSSPRDAIDLLWRVTRLVLESRGIKME